LIAGLAFAGIFCASLVVMAPASLLGAQLERFSGGRLSLANTNGTIWSGSGILLFRNDTQFISLGDYAWQIRPAELPSNGLVYEVRHGEGAPPMRARYAVLRQEAELSQWRMVLPAQILAVLSPQLKPYQLHGEVRLATDSLTFSAGGILGRATVDWMQAGSRLTDVYPLGDYRIQMAGTGAGLSIQLSTLAGKLRLSGSGQVVPGRGLTFNGEAQAAPGEQQEALTDLLHRVGPQTSPGVFALALIPQS
jgi:general secretion pathway protein N